MSKVELLLLVLFKEYSVPSRLAKSAVILAARYPGHPFNSSVISPRVIREFRRISINKK